MLNPPLHLYLMRHGETVWSRTGQYTGRTDLPLTTHGEQAARELGQLIRGVPFTRVLTSPLQRAQQTCALAGLPLAAEVEPDLIEWDNGDDEGRLPADILKSQPGWNLFRDGSPNGESPSQLATRADRLIGRLQAEGGIVALFSHGHFCRVLAARWIGLSVAQGEHFLLNTASYGILCYEHGDINEPAIELWNAPASEEADRETIRNDDDRRTMKQRAIDRWENEGGEILKAQPEHPGVLGPSSSDKCSGPVAAIATP